MDHGGRRERDEVFSILRRKARVRRHGYNSTRCKRSVFAAWHFMRIAFLLHSISQADHFV